MAVFPTHIPTTITAPHELPVGIETKTSALQEKTNAACLDLFRNPINRIVTAEADGESSQLPRLGRPVHVDYLRSVLDNESKLHLMMDPSKPWMVYWAITALAALGEDVETDKYRQGVIQALRPCQNPDGGFGGGHGHISHCAPSYAATLALSVVGGEEALSVIDRRSMWRWLGQMKLPDGGFLMNAGGEMDVRGAFCALVILSILDLPAELPEDAPARKAGLTTFICRLPEWISRCQTYEGGIGSVPGGEAHGAFSFCALNALGLIGPPQTIVPRYINMTSFTRWLSLRQCPEGGFAGRTNKLVDGCYSFWNGGTWAFTDAAIGGLGSIPVTKAGKNIPFASAKTPLSAWIGSSRASVGVDKEETWSRAELIHYVLHCCQDPEGGLVDKPGVRPDAYHTLYNLAGLSMAQNRFFVPDESAGAESEWPKLMRPGAWKFVPVQDPATPAAVRTEFAASEDSDPTWTDPFSSRVVVFNPVYAVPWGVAERAWAWHRTRPWTE